MSSRKPPANKKPIIYYSGLFHYIEGNESLRDNEAQYTLFQIYNLTKSAEELEHAIIEAIGSVTINILDNNLLAMERSYIAIEDETRNTIKLKINLNSHRHRDVIEKLRISQTIRDLSVNGFADWIPLDILSFTAIERSFKANKNQAVAASNMRCFGDMIALKLLEQVLNELILDSTITALEKLFPGTITTINREVNDTSMIVVEIKIEHECDNELGRLFIEILNSLIEDRKINQNTMENHGAFFNFLISMFSVIRNLTHLNELYGTFRLPSWVPLIENPEIIEVKKKIHQGANNDKTVLHQINSYEDDKMFEQLHEIVGQLHQETILAIKKLEDESFKRKSLLITSKICYYGSIASTIILPIIYCKKKSILPLNPSKGSILISLSILTNVWSNKIYKEYQEAIDFTSIAVKILSATTQNVESLNSLLFETSFGPKIILNDQDLKGRKTILRLLFDKFIFYNSEVRRDFMLS